MSSYGLFQVKRSKVIDYKVQTFIEGDRVADVTLYRVQSIVSIKVR